MPGVAKERLAAELGRFLFALRHAPADGGPAAGAHSFYRGASLRHYDDETRTAVARLGSRIPAERVLATWDDALAAP